MLLPSLFSPVFSLLLPYTSMVQRLSLALPRSCWFLSCSVLLGGLGGLRPPRSFPVFHSFFPASSLLFRVSLLLCLPSVLLSSSDLVPPCSPHGASVVLSQPCWFSSLALPRSCWFLSCSLLFGGLGGLRPPRSFHVLPSFFLTAPPCFLIAQLALCASLFF